MNAYEASRLLGEGHTIFDLSLRVTFYARVSTGSGEQAHSLTNQIEYYREFIRACDNWTFVEGYIDEAQSGTSVKRRDAFLRMLEDARAGLFDFIITKEISRFSRNTLDSILYTRELLRANVGVLFQADNINTFYGDSELRLTIMASLAQDEVRRISERVRFGFRRAVEQGVVLGNSKIWGYEKREGKLIIVEEEAETVRDIFTMYAMEGCGIRAVCKRLTDAGKRNGNGNPFSFSTIRGILTNPKYMGYYCGNKTRKLSFRESGRQALPVEEWRLYKDEDAVPPIVSEELWRRANAILASRGEKLCAEESSSYRNKYAFSGVVFCAAHGAPYYRAAINGKELWRCREYVRSGKAGCASPAVYTSGLTEIARRELALETGVPQLFEAMSRVYAKAGAESGAGDAAAKRGESVEAIKRKKSRLLDLRLDGTLSKAEFAAKNAELDARRKALDERAASQCESPGEKALLEALDAAFTRLPEDGDVIKALFSRIEISRAGEAVGVSARLSGGEEKKYRFSSLCSGQYICSEWI